MGYRLQQKKRDGTGPSRRRLCRFCYAATALPLRYSRASLLAKTFLVFWVFFLFWFFFSLSLLPPGPPPSLFFLYIIHDQSLQGHMLGAPTALRSRRRPTTASSSSHCLSLFSLFL